MFTIPSKNTTGAHRTDGIGTFYYEYTPSWNLIAFARWIGQCSRCAAAVCPLHANNTLTSREGLNNQLCANLATRTNRSTPDEHLPTSASLPKDSLQHCRHAPNLPPRWPPLACQSNFSPTFRLQLRAATCICACKPAVKAVVYYAL